jgi:hypothetical protein
MKETLMKCELLISPWMVRRAYEAEEAFVSKVQENYVTSDGEVVHTALIVSVDFVFGLLGVLEVVAAHCVTCFYLFEATKV